MTHFRTYCIGEYDEEALCEKFSEYTEVPPYRKGVVGGEEIVRFVDYYANQSKTIPVHARKIVDELGPRMRKLVREYNEYNMDHSLEDNTPNPKVKEIVDQVFKPLYDVLGRNWNSERWKFNDQGVLEEWSTYNPNTVFDYFQQIGKTTLGEMTDPEIRLTECCGFFLCKSPEDIEYTRFENVGWFGYSESVMDNKTQEDKVRDAIAGLPPETPIYTFDCHI